MRKATKAWVEFAKSDIIAAEKLMDVASIYNVVLFHCHQAVEKILKAALEEFSFKIPYIHDIDTLYNSIPDELKSVLNISQEKIKKIDEIYSGSRYPSDIGLLPTGYATEEEAKERYEIAKNIFDKVSKYLKKIKN